MNQFLAGNECEELTHSQQLPQAPKTHKQVDYQNHIALGPQRSLLYRLKDSIEVKCKVTHSATNWVKFTWLQENKKHSQKQKSLTRAINQTKIKQVRRSATYQFGYQIPRDYKHTLELDKLNGITKMDEDTLSRLLAIALRMHRTLTCLCSLNNQCEY